MQLVALTLLRQAILSVPSIDLDHHLHHFLTSYQRKRVEDSVGYSQKARLTANLLILHRFLVYFPLKVSDSGQDFGNSS